MVKKSSKIVEVVIVGRFFVHFGPDLGGRWSLLTGGRCSEVDLVLKLLGRDLEWSLLTGGRYSEVVVSTGLTVLLN
jgi:hypothetical protein